MLSKDIYIVEVGHCLIEAILIILSNVLLPQ